jgi:uncharacterized membrane protein YfcA
MSILWLPIAATCLIGVSCGLPLFLYLRERQLAAILIGLVVPFTFIVIMPTNRRLLENDRDWASEQTRLLLVRWGTLHAVRTWLSFAAFVVDLWLLSAA